MPTRISGACNGCRSKKQKCSGDKTGCAQCEAAGIPCTWPEQRKRGPAKGYIEGLENRLHDAESLLLQVLPLISTEQLHAATLALSNNIECDDSGRGSPDRRGSPPILNKKTGIEYWENFPLTTVTGIQRWQQDCEAHHGTSNQSLSLSAPKSDTRHSSPASQSHDSSRRNRHSVGVAVVAEARSHNDYDGSQTLDMYKMPSDHEMSGQMMTTTTTSNSRRSNNHGVYSNQPHHNDWQTSMMNINNNNNNHHNASSSQMSHQLFSQAGYMHNSWPQHHSQGMHIPTTNSSQRHNAMSIESGQNHSHLFW